MREAKNKIKKAMIYLNISIIVLYGLLYLTNLLPSSDIWSNDSFLVLILLFYLYLLYKGIITRPIMIGLPLLIFFLIVEQYISSRPMSITFDYNNDTVHRSRYLLICLSMFLSAFLNLILSFFLSRKIKEK